MITLDGLLPPTLFSSTPTTSKTFPSLIRSSSDPRMWDLLLLWAAEYTLTRFMSKGKRTGRLRLGARRPLYPMLEAGCKAQAIQPCHQPSALERTMRLVRLKPSENNFGSLIPSFKSFRLLSRAVNCFKLIESHIQTVSFFFHTLASTS